MAGGVNPIKKKQPGATPTPIDISRLKLQVFMGFGFLAGSHVLYERMWEAPPSGGVIPSHESRDNYIRSSL